MTEMHEKSKLGDMHGSKLKNDVLYTCRYIQIMEDAVYYICSMNAVCARDGQGRFTPTIIFHCVLIECIVVGMPPMCIVGNEV